MPSFEIGEAIFFLRGGEGELNTEAVIGLERYAVEIAYQRTVSTVDYYQVRTSPAGLHSSDTDSVENDAARNEYHATKSHILFTSRFTRSERLSNTH